MKQENLQILLTDLREQYAALNFCQNSQRRMFEEMNRLQRFATLNGFENYSHEVGEKFLETRCGFHVTDESRNLRPYQQQCRYHVNVLNYFLETKTLRKGIRQDLKIVPAVYKMLYDSFISYQQERLTNSSLLNCRRHALHFFTFLSDRGIRSIDTINGTIISEYCKSFTNYDNCTIHTYICDLRALLRFLFEFEYAKTDFSIFIPQFRLYRDAHIPTTWTADETSKLLQAINRCESLGKRDFAMILLIVQLGMRICDVINLQFSNIDWRNKRIILIQKKNLRQIEYPLPQESINAIIDYLRNGRPKIQSPYVFIKHVVPYGKFSEHNSFWVIFLKYLAKAGLPRKPRGTAHSFRHSFATRLLANKTGMTQISELLGHSCPKTTLAYLRIDTTALRSCCLSFTGKDETK